MKFLSLFGRRGAGRAACRSRKEEQALLLQGEFETGLDKWVLTCRGWGEGAGRKLALLVARRCEPTLRLMTHLRAWTQAPRPAAGDAAGKEG